ncbi:MAG: hypothetical protein AAGE65_10040 [Planctomycetota bacterium]
MAKDFHDPASDEGMSRLFYDLRNVWDAYGTYVLWVVVVGSFSYLAFSLYSYNRVTTQEAAWSDLANSTAPASFEQVAADHGSPAVRQIALLQAADMYLGETAALGEGEALTAKLDQAEAIYRRVADEATDDIFRINALEGLAVVAEGRRDLDEAAARNDAVIALAETLPGFESWTARANARKQLLPQLAEPVSFTEEAEPDEAPEASEAGTAVGEADASSEVPDLLDDSLELDPVAIPTE